MNKLKETIAWWQQFNGNNVVITTETHEFSMNLSVSQLPHLLGVHYAIQSNLKGYRLFNQIQKMNDAELLSKVHENNPQMVKSVKERIHYFKYFMEHLEDALLVESTNPNTKIKSEFLLIRSEDNKVLHLGIGTTAHEDYFETFMIRDDTFYFKDTKMIENIVSIQKWEQDGTLVPFSFKEEPKQEITHSKQTIKM